MANKIQRLMYGFKYINNTTDFKKSESYVASFFFDLACTSGNNFLIVTIFVVHFHTALKA